MRTRTIKVLIRAALALAIIGSSVVSITRRAEAVAWRWPHRCFFDPDSADLTLPCQQIIGEAVASWHREQKGHQLKSDLIDAKDPYAPPYTARLQVRGYAPDASTPRAADQLSIRRAAAVATELMRLGIPENLVTPIGFGNERALVPDLPLDPGNRLVWIIFY